MPSLFDLIDFTDPFVWAYHILGVTLLPAIYVALFGKQKSDIDKTWAYRGAGFEIVFVLLPFFIYFLINLFSGQVNSLLLSPELPMASLLLCSISLLWIMKGARETKDIFAIEGLQVLQLVTTIFFVINSIIIYYLTTTPNVPEYFSVINAVLIAVCTYVSYGIVAMMTYASKYPERLLSKS